MKSYIEFLYDNNNKYIAKIHKDGKVRVIKNQYNIKKLISIAKKYGFKIDGEGIIKTNVFLIVKDYEAYYKKRKRICIFGNINSNMKLSHKDVSLGKTIVYGTLTAIVLIAGIGGISHITSTASTNDTDNSQYEVLVEDDEIEDETNNELQKMLQNDSFHFSYQNRQTTDNIYNAQKYRDLFQKYGKMYGIDPQLLMAIAAQESGGDHYANLGSGSAEGIMQIEKAVHLGHNVSAYNFNTGEMETIFITRERLQDLETNIKIGAMIARNSIENCNYNIPLGLQTYNFGPGNMATALNMCCDIERINKDDIRNNPTNNIWLNYRAFLHTGDAKYVEHVFSFMNNNTEITVLDRNGKKISVRIANDYQRQNKL